MTLASTDSVFLGEITKEQSNEDVNAPKSRIPRAPELFQTDIKSFFSNSLKKLESPKKPSLLKLNEDELRLIESADKTALSEAKQRIKILVIENDSLIGSNEAKQEQIDDLLQKNSNLAAVAREEQDIGRDLEEKLELLIEERNKLETQKSELGRELRQLTSDLANAEADNEKLVHDIELKRRECDEKKAKCAELMNVIESVTSRYQKQLKESNEANEREKDLVEELKIKSAELEEFAIKYTELVKKEKNAQERNENLVLANASLEKKIIALEKKELLDLEEKQRLKHDMEEAIFYKETAESREKKLNQQIKEISAEMALIPKQYAEKNEQQLQALRTQFNSDRRKFAEETCKLEELVAKLQSQAERAIREKRAAESELEKVTRHIPAESDRLTMALEEAHSKLRASEREKNDAIHKAESLRQKLIREQNQNESERSQLYDKAEDAFRRLKRLESEEEEGKTQRLTLMNRICTLEQECKQLHESKIQAQATHEAQNAGLAQKYKDQIDDLESKLEIVGDAHARATNELQTLLKDQRQLSERWKNESAEMRTHYEQLITKTRQETEQYKQRISQLEINMSRLATQRQEVFDQITLEKKDKAVLNSRLAQAERNAENLSKQIRDLVEKETEMLEERKRLQRMVDRATISATSNAFSRATKTAAKKVSDRNVDELEAEIERIASRSTYEESQSKSPRSPVKIFSDSSSHFGE